MYSLSIYILIFVTSLSTIVLRTCINQYIALEHSTTVLISVPAMEERFSAHLRIHTVSSRHSLSDVTFNPKEFVRMSRWRKIFAVRVCLRRRTLVHFVSFLPGMISRTRIVTITFTTLWTNMAGEKLTIFFIIFFRKEDLTFLANFLPFLDGRIWHFMHIVSIENNLYEMSNPVFWEK